MKRHNGDYREEFNDPAYEEQLGFWLTILEKTSQKFYYASHNVGDARILTSHISHLPNNLLLHQAVINALSDIKRIKEYHSVGNVELIKFAAYIGYWLARAKPFALKLENYAAPIQKNGVMQCGVFNFCISLNEAFVADFIFAAVFCKDVEADVLSANNTCLHMRREHGVKFLPSETILSSLHYYLCYRLRGAQELELFLKGLLACPIDFAGQYRGQTASLPSKKL